MPNIYKRNLPANNVQDQGAISVLQYNDAAGSQKVSEVGKHLLPIPNGAGSYTTTPTTATCLPVQGACLAVYNNSATLGSITLGENNTITSLAAGVTDANGHVGIPCMPNAWTYVACGAQQWVISNAATTLVFLVDDNTSISFASYGAAST